MTFSQVKNFATAHGVTYYKIGPIYGTIAPKLLTAFGLNAFWKNQKPRSYIS